MKIEQIPLAVLKRPLMCQLLEQREYKLKGSYLHAVQKANEQIAIDLKKSKGVFKEA